MKPSSGNNHLPVNRKGKLHILGSWAGYWNFRLRRVKGNFLHNVFMMGILIFVLTCPSEIHLTILTNFFKMLHRPLLAMLKYEVGQSPVLGPVLYNFDKLIWNATSTPTLHAMLKYGVPQSSLDLFLLHINGLNHALKYCKVHHFADDTNLLHYNCLTKKLDIVIKFDMKHLTV